jgi:hypothetical protein
VRREAARVPIALHDITPLPLAQSPIVESAYANAWMDAWVFAWIAHGTQALQQAD